MSASTMLRQSLARSIGRSHRPASRALHFSRSTAIARLQPRTAKPLAIVATAVFQPSHFLRYYSIDRKAEAEIGSRRLEPHPNEVSLGSSTSHIRSHEAQPESDTDMMKGIWSDLATVKETFALSEVPKEVLFIGLAGILPYVATSMSTAFLAWDINYALEHGAGLFLSGADAQYYLNILQPVQVGYGAIILSFLGAIHWGLEFAGYGGHQRYNRYAIGVFATAVAWPTILLPIEYALISQFLAFNALYFLDARAARNGWAPAWYSPYRFLLTFIVGASIVVSLIGRGQIFDSHGRMPGPTDKLQALRDSDWDALEKEERERLKAVAEKASNGDEDGDSEKEDDEDEDEDKE